MPELPEVETMVRGIRGQVEGGRIVGLFKCRSSLKPIGIRPSWATIRRKAKGQTISTVRRLGKRVVLDLSSGESFVIEPRMTGLMLLADPPDAEHLRLEWKLEKAGRVQSLWFWDRRGLGTLRLFAAEELQKELGPETLGFDALEMTPARWRTVCEKTSRAIKALMLDQKFVAGIGNIYASEILHKAGIAPECPAGELDQAALNRLASATRLILSRAIKAEGSTLEDGTYRNVLNQNGSYQNEHKVYQKDGEPCPTCGAGIIERKVLGQRATFFCPACQPLVPRG